MHYATSDWYTPHRAPTHYFQLAPTATVSSLLYIYSIYFLAIFISYFVLFLSLQIFKCKDADQAKASGGLPAPAMRNCSLYSLPLSWFLSRFPKQNPKKMNLSLSPLSPSISYFFFTFSSPAYCITRAWLLSHRSCSAPLTLPHPLRRPTSLDQLSYIKPIPSNIFLKSAGGGRRWSYHQTAKWAQSIHWIVYK